MIVSLREVTTKNFFACLRLKVNENQENFVASNVRSIAESKIFTYLIPQTIYANQTLIGFAMYGRDPDDGTYWIVRLMIDEKFQGKGYGKSATRELINKIKKLPDCNEIFLSFVPENVSAEKLYQSLGFKLTGKTDDTGEIIMRLPIY